ncbi:MAG: aspartate/glutamate racemase family protein [Clostridia bacterium]|nr:aspartate/glutamate racemase family protein [Clostridia bacterium]
MIGILDSGSGGVNVIKECKKYYNEDFVYLIDNKNCPYGNKPPLQVQSIVINNLMYLINHYDLDFIIVGCNTASALLPYNILEEFAVPVLKTKPDMHSLAQQKNITCLFATKNTIKYSNFIKYFLLNYNHIKTLYIKDLPKLIDEKLTKNDEQTSKKIEKKLKNGVNFKKKLKMDCECIALGCTHFKHIAKQIEDCFKNKITMFECEKEVAKLSKYFVRKSKRECSVEIVLTEPNNALKKQIIQMLL